MSFTAGIMDLRDHERRTIDLKARNNFTLFLMYLTTVVHYVREKNGKRSLISVLVCAKQMELISVFEGE